MDKNKRKPELDLFTVLNSEFHLPQKEFAMEQKVEENNDLNVDNSEFVE